MIRAARPYHLAPNFSNVILVVPRGCQKGRGDACSLASYGLLCPEYNRNQSYREGESDCFFFKKKSKTKVLQSQGVSLWLGPTPYIHYAWIPYCLKPTQCEAYIIWEKTTSLCSRTWNWPREGKHAFLVWNKSRLYNKHAKNPIPQVGLHWKPPQSIGRDEWRYPLNNLTLQLLCEGLINEGRERYKKVIKTSLQKRKS